MLHTFSHTTRKMPQRVITPLQRVIAAFSYFLFMGGTVGLLVLIAAILAAI